jgi:GNAT superfamily N-acetyltransferase
MPTLTITSEPDASREERNVLIDSVDNYNMRVTGDADYYPINLFLRDDNGAIRGGVLCDLWGGWLHIRFLWVDEALRKQGFGSRLLVAAEEEAWVKGARNAFVETFSFQARPLYERHGYRVFGELEDYPPGHRHYFLRKAL